MRSRMGNIVIAALFSFSCAAQAKRDNDQWGSSEHSRKEHQADFGSSIPCGDLKVLIEETDPNTGFPYRGNRSEYGLRNPRAHR